MPTYSRRCLFRAMAAVVLPAPRLWAQASPRLATGNSTPYAQYEFFDAPEARFIEAACDCWIPADDRSQGALELSIPRYLDRQLGGPWGKGTALYRDGPGQPGTPLIWAPGLTPAEFARAGLAAIGDSPIVGAPVAARRDYLHRFAAGRVDLGGIDSAALSRLLLNLTLEGYLSLAPPDTTRALIRWPMTGFPGAHVSVVPT